MTNKSNFVGFLLENPKKKDLQNSPSNLVTSVHTVKRPSSNDGMPGRSCLKLIFGAINPVSKANSTLVILHTPAVDSLWPIFDLTEPTGNGFLRFLQKIVSIAAHSSGSPTTVPSS